MWIRENKEPIPPWSWIGRTETVKDSLHPEFATPLVMNYYFEKKQHLKFEIFDEDGPGKERRICQLETTMANILSAPDQILKRNMLASKSNTDGPEADHCHCTHEEERETV